ncbi:MAG: transketolase [Microbacteriaceae bacterium]
MTLTPNDTPTLALSAARARRHVLRMFAAAGSGHLGGAFSCLDMVTALYSRVLRIDPANPGNPDRDRFLLSAGHKALAQYAVLAEHGFFDLAVLDTYGDRGSHLPGHPDMHKLAGVEGNTGALGHGSAIAAGMALAAKIDGRDYRVFTILGDGELPEGSNWEAFAAAAHHGLDNLVTVIDNNDFQISGSVDEIMNMHSIADKMRAFGWAVREIDGHDFDQITEAFTSTPFEPGRPSAILAHTIKGHGISALAGRIESHYWSPSDAELAAAVSETDTLIEQLAREVTR